jgi:hypothetical protein
MPPLGIVIFGCLTKPKYREQIEDCYATWVHDAIEAGCLVRFYVGDIPSDLDPTLKELCVDLHQGDEYISATFKQWKGFDHMLSMEPPCEFYCTCGTDTFLNIPNVLTTLAHYDSTKPYYIGGGEGEEPVDGITYKYYSGGAGVFLSYPALQQVMEQVPDFMPWWMVVGMNLVDGIDNGELIQKSILGASDLQLGILCIRENIPKISLGSSILVGDGTHNREGLNKDTLLSCHLMKHNDFYDYWRYIHREKIDRGDVP